MSLYQVRSPTAPSPYVHIEQDGIAFWFRGSVSYEFDVLTDPDVIFSSKMIALAVWLAEEVPANRLMI